MMVRLRITSLGGIGAAVPYIDATHQTRYAQPNDEVEDQDWHAARLIATKRAELISPSEPDRPPPDPLALPKLIPARERAEDEPEQEGFSYCADVDAECRASAPEQWGQYEAKLPDIPRLADERQRSWWLAGIVCGWSEEEALLAEFRESLEIHHRERWREQHKRCFGFCIETNRREEIFPSAAPHMRFDGFTAENVQTGRHYDLVLFYDLAPGVDIEASQQVKIDKVIELNEAELRRLYQLAIERSRNRPKVKELVDLIMSKGKFPKNRRSLVEKCLRNQRADW